MKPEGFVVPAATIAGGAFLLSPFGIPMVVRGVPRVLLAGLGGFVAGKVADNIVERFGYNTVSQQVPEEGFWDDDE